MGTGCVGGYLGDEVHERLSSQLLDPLRVEAGQVVGLGLPLCFAAAVKRPVLWGDTPESQRTAGGGRVQVCPSSSRTQQVFEQRLVLLPDAVEGGPARAAVGQRVLPDPAAAGELVEVLAGVGAAVHRLHDLTRHRDARLRQAQATPTVCRTTWKKKEDSLGKICEQNRKGENMEGKGRVKIQTSEVKL